MATTLAFCRGATAPVCRYPGALLLAKNGGERKLTLEAPNQGRFLRALTKLAKVHFFAAGAALVFAPNTYFGLLGAYTPTGVAEMQLAKLVGGAYLTNALVLKDRYDGDNARAGFATVAPMIVLSLLTQRSMFSANQYALKPAGMALIALKVLEAGVGGWEWAKIVRDRLRESGAKR